MKLLSPFSSRLLQRITVLLLLFAGLQAALAQEKEGKPESLFRIDVVEEGSGWPVPLVELRTTHNVRFVSDNRGIIAFDLPELMGRDTWFSVKGHGYEVKADGFGYRGVKLKPTPGGKATVTVKRRLPARRIGRLTGGGLFGESQRFGLEQDWEESGILGCDSVQVAEHDGKIFWAWGDTNLPRYPLGLFHMSSATTGPAPLKSFEPPLRLRFDYFQDADNRVRSVAEMPGKGPTWVSGYVSLPDQNGRSRLVGTYVKVRKFLEVYETGLCVWNEEKSVFVKHRTLWTKTAEDSKPPRVPDGH
ncbi:MAG: hypothetical protein HKN23_05015, partial [Verrucomicrobiales bacterium]|nr:hypothetical protein [Verrucomicrobiales bacterium]